MGSAAGSVAAAAGSTGGSSAVPFSAPGDLPLLPRAEPLALRELSLPFFPELPRWLSPPLFFLPSPLFGVIAGEADPFGVGEGLAFRGVAVGFVAGGIGPVR